MAYNGGTISDFAVNITDYQIDANVDNFDATNLTIVKLINDTGGSLNFTGIIAEAEGHYIILYNSSTSTDNVVIKHDTTSTAANRFFSSTGADITLTPGDKIEIIYLDSRWRD